VTTIDADAHVIETEHTWEYGEPSEEKLMPKALTQGGVDYWLIDDRLFLRRRNFGHNTPVASQELRDVSARLRHMDELEIDVQVIYPTLGLIPLTKRPDVELAMDRSYNRWMADIWSQGNGRVRWAAVVPWLSIDEAVAETRWAKEHGACAVFIRGLEAERTPSDPYFFPVYAEAERLNLPLCLHAGNASFARHDLYVSDLMSKFKLPVAGAFHEIVAARISERFPRLRFGFIEATAQWVPWAITFTNQILEREKRPIPDKLMVDHRLYVTCELIDDLDYVLRYAGEDNLLIGTDYGHADTSAVLEALQHLMRQEERVSPTAIQKILDDNPRALYAL
jgi:predicted TIM-barrel fold metal-dependent hydrolase